MQRRIALLLMVLVGAAPARATQRALPGVHAGVLSIGAGVVRGPGPIAHGRNAGGARERLTARFADGIAMTLAAGREWNWGGAEVRLLIPASELQVTNDLGHAFPHHASHPALWSAGVMAYPLPRLGSGLGRRLRPFAAAGAGGMLVSADLDNIDGASMFHPWLWTLGAGLRLALGNRPPQVGGTMLELRFLHLRLGAAGPFQRGEVTAVTLALGLGW